MLLTSVLFTLIACDTSNPPELNEAVKGAADTYCACVKKNVSMPRGEAKSAGSGGRPCAGESDAFGTAWEALPEKGNDPKSDALWKQKDVCARELSNLELSPQ